MSPFLQFPSYQDIVNTIWKSVALVSEKIFTRAIEEEKKATNSSDLTVSGDGTWKKQGFISLHGVSSLIAYNSNKVFDVNAKSKICQKCNNAKKNLMSMLLKNGMKVTLKLMSVSVIILVHLDLWSQIRSSKCSGARKQSME